MELKCPGSSPISILINKFLHLYVPQFPITGIWLVLAIKYCNYCKPQRTLAVIEKALNKCYFSKNT